MPMTFCAEADGILGIPGADWYNSGFYLYLADYSAFFELLCGE